MAQIDVSTDQLLALSRRLSDVADELDRRRLGARDAVGATAPRLGGEITGHTLTLADAADEALAQLVGSYRSLSAVLSTSAGVYVDTDTAAPARQRNPALQ